MRFALWMRWMLAWCVAGLATAQEPNAQESNAQESKPVPVLQIGHGEPLLSMALSKDGKKLLTGSFDRTAILWDVETGRKIRTLEGHNHWVTCVAFSPDGKTLLTSDYTTILWDAATGKKLASLEHNRDNVYSAAFSPDGKQVLTAATDSTARLWDVATAKVVHATKHRFYDVKPVAFSPDGKLCLSASPGEVILWDAGTGKTLHTFPSAGGHDVRGLAFTPDGTTIIVNDGQVTLWDVAKKEKLRTLDAPRWVRSIAVSADSKTLAMARSEQTSIAMWDLASGVLERTFEVRAPKGSPFSRRHDVDWVALDEQGRRLVARHGTRAVVLNRADGAQVREFELARPQVGEGGAAVAFSSDSKQLFVHAQAETLVWETDALRLRRRLSLRRPPLFIDAMRFRSDGRTLVAKDVGDLLLLQDTASGAVSTIRDIKGLDGRSKALDISPDGAMLLFGSEIKEERKHTAMLLDVKLQKLLHAFAGHEQGLSGGVRCGAISPDGKRVVTGGKCETKASDKSVILWDAASGAKVRSFRAADVDGSDPSCVAFSRDGKKIITGYGAQVAVIWDADSGEKVHILKPDAPYDHHGLAMAAFSPDGEVVAAAYYTAGVGIWSVKTGKQLHRLTSHNGPVLAVAFSPDGRRLCTAAVDGTRLSDVATGRELAQFLSPGGDDWLVVTPEGYYDASPGGQRLIAWRVGDKLLDPEQSSRFHRPAAVHAILRGDEPPK